MLVLPEFLYFMAAPDVPGRSEGAK